MDIDRTQAAEQQTTDHRARTHAAGERSPGPTDSAPVSRPEHGGAVPVSRSENGPGHEDDDRAAAQERRRAALATIAKQVHLPYDTDLDIEVDVANEQVTFVIRDRDTGKLLRRIPEGEAETLFERLREFHGVLVDRSL